MLLEAEDPAGALQAYEASIAKEPGRFRGAYGAARAAEASGNSVAARRYYDAVIELARDADSARPEIERAEAFVRRSR
jgi:hypothetical protein